MSTPSDADKVDSHDALQVAMCEIISAQSSLNMYPEPMPAEEIQAKKDAGQIDGYLSETDSWASHSMEHLRAACSLIRKAGYLQDSLKNQVYVLVMQLREAGIKPKRKTWLDEESEVVG